MDHKFVTLTHGISKVKRDKQRKMLKKAVRHLSMKAPGDPYAHGSAGKQYQDVTKQLLELASQRVNINKVSSSKGASSSAGAVEINSDALLPKDTISCKEKRHIDSECCSDELPTDNHSCSTIPVFHQSTRKNKMNYFASEGTNQKMKKNVERHMDQPFSDTKSLHKQKKSISEEFLEMPSKSSAIVCASTFLEKGAVLSEKSKRKHNVSGKRKFCTEEKIRTADEVNQDENRDWAEGTRSSLDIQGPKKHSKSNSRVSKQQPSCSGNGDYSVEQDNEEETWSDTIPAENALSSEIIEGSVNSITPGNKDQCRKAYKNHVSSENINDPKILDNEMPEKISGVQEKRLTPVKGTESSIFVELKKSKKGTISKKANKEKRQKTEEKYIEKHCSEEFHSEQVNEGRSFSVEEQDSISHSQVAEKCHKKRLKAVKHGFLNSDPIVVEMSSTHHVPSNPFSKNMSGLKTVNITRTHNDKADTIWNVRSICSTQKWKVQYGDVEEFSDMHEGNVESTISPNLMPARGGDEMLTHESKKTANHDAVSIHEKNTMSDMEMDTDNATDSETRGDFLSCRIFEISKTKILLALPPSESLFFRGALNVEVLIGSIDVLGCNITCGSLETFTVYSPHGFSLLCFQACDHHEKLFSKEEILKYMKCRVHEVDKGTEILDFILKFPVFTSFIFLESVNSTLISFLDKYFPALHFPTPMYKMRGCDAASAHLRAEFVKPDTIEHVKLYKRRDEWTQLVEFLKEREPGELKVITCGGKGVGKSTLLRFLVNQLLRRFGSVIYIDFDPGQSEFAPPGCVSAVQVLEPLLGPNFTHHREPDCMVYVGEVDISKCAHHYIQCAQFVINWCHSQEVTDKPWIINTMGFSKGLGVDLTTDIIKMTNPSDLIQIESQVKKRNYPFKLKADAVQSYPSSFCSLADKQDSALHYSFHEMPSAAEAPNKASTPWGMEAQVLRETALVAYFSRLVSQPALSLLEARPFVLSFAGLKLCVCHEKLKFSDYLAAMNGNLVALCAAKEVGGSVPSDPTYPEILETTPICHCVGFGIVRGVDMEKKVLFIISPVSSFAIKLVDCLILGAVRLPSNVYTLQDGAFGNIPYVIKGALQPLNKEVKKMKSSVSVE